MRPMPNETLEKMRDVACELDYFGQTAAGTGSGFFRARLHGDRFTIITSCDKSWEHVSVSTRKRCPTWEEMCIFKNLFWLPEEAVMQLHPPERDHVNNHLYCLHLWKPVQLEIPLPPSIMVGVKAEGLIKSPQEARRLHEKYASVVSK